MVTAVATLLQLILWIFGIIISFVTFPREILKCKKKKKKISRTVLRLQERNNNLKKYIAALMN